MYSTAQFFIITVIIGIATLGLRAIFLYYVPRFIEKPIIKRGMDAVPAAMLVALVIPFTFFSENRFNIMRFEVLAIVITVPIVLKTRRYAYGLLIAFICYELFLLL